jgi:hypothetical protein
MNKLKSALNRPVYKHIALFFVGAIVGTILYPTKTIEEKLSKKHQQEIVSLKEAHAKEYKKLEEVSIKTNQEYDRYKKETDIKLSKQTEEVKDLKKKQKTSYYKIVKPDGTIEIKKFSESETSESSRIIQEIKQEFKLKIDSIEEKWEKIHKSRVEDLYK